jgi:hypothetical protein
MKKTLSNFSKKNNPSVLGLLTQLGFDIPLGIKVPDDTRQRIYNMLSQMDRQDSLRFYESLGNPNIFDSVELFKKYELNGKDRSIVKDTAQRLIIDDTALAYYSVSLNERLEEALDSMFSS